MGIDPRERRRTRHSAHRRSGVHSCGQFQEPRAGHESASDGCLQVLYAFEPEEPRRLGHVEFDACAIERFANCPNHYGVFRLLLLALQQLLSQAFVFHRLAPARSRARDSSRLERFALDVEQALGRGAQEDCVTAALSKARTRGVGAAQRVEARHGVEAFGAAEASPPREHHLFEITGGDGVERIGHRSFEVIRREWGVRVKARLPGRGCVRQRCGEFSFPGCRERQATRFDPLCALAGAQRQEGVRPVDPTAPQAQEFRQDESRGREVRPMLVSGLPRGEGEAAGDERCPGLHALDALRQVLERRVGCAKALCRVRLDRLAAAERQEGETFRGSFPIEAVRSVAGELRQQVRVGDFHGHGQIARRVAPHRGTSPVRIWAEPSRSSRRCTAVKPAFPSRAQSSSPGGR